MKLKIALIPGLGKIYSLFSKAVDSCDRSVSSLRLGVLIVIVTCCFCMFGITVCFGIGMLRVVLYNPKLISDSAITPLISGTEAVCYIGALGTVIGIALWGKNASNPTTNQANIEKQEIISGQREDSPVVKESER